MDQEEKQNIRDGKYRLLHPVLPLVDMVQFLYLTGPLGTIDGVLKEMKEVIEIKGSVYENPCRSLAPYVEILQDLEVVKSKRKLSYSFPFIVNEKEEPQAKLQSLELWIKQRVLTKELEEINSILCKPCGCVLCCTGPDSGFDETAGYKKKMVQEFFSEIQRMRSIRIGTG